VAFNYANARATADKLLKNFGQAATLTRIVTGAYDPATGVGATTSTAVAVTAVLLEYSDAQRASAGGLIQQKDRKALVAVEAQTVAPDVEDTLTVGGEVFKIVACRPLSPAGVDVLYTLQVRK
jgi:hypothetical protein